MPPIPTQNQAPVNAGDVFKAGNAALITGGASGIGLAIAKLCRNSGMRVGIVDRNSELLDEAKKALAFGKPEEVSLYEADVSKPDDWKLLKSDALKQLGRIDLLVLNAGVSGKGSWGDADYFDKILQTNLFGVVYGLNAFVPSIKEQEGQSAIVITGSKQGITNPPSNPAYNASKAAVKTLAEHLSYDFKGSKTTVHLLIPGWTFTGLVSFWLRLVSDGCDKLIARQSGGAPGSSKEKPAGAWTPDQVAEYLLEKMKNNKFYVLCPDNDVPSELDRKRIMWSTGDLVYDRPPLTRWRDDYAQEAKEWMEENSF
jgi:NAD(P)-dependent dehydrogenase (short-subunit alcohol dehydrogenase family)